MFFRTDGKAEARMKSMTVRVPFSAVRKVARNASRAKFDHSRPATLVAKESRSMAVDSLGWSLAGAVLEKTPQSSGTPGTVNAARSVSRPASSSIIPDPQCSLQKNREAMAADSLGWSLAGAVLEKTSQPSGTPGTVNAARSVRAGEQTEALVFPEDATRLDVPMRVAEKWCTGSVCAHNPRRGRSVARPPALSLQLRPRLGVLVLGNHLLGRLPSFTMYLGFRLPGPLSDPGKLHPRLSNVVATQLGDASWDWYIRHQQFRGLCFRTDGNAEARMKRVTGRVPFSAGGRWREMQAAPHHVRSSPTTILVAN